MSQLTVKRLLIYTVFILFLNGCGGSSGGSGSGSITTSGSNSSGVTVEPRDDGTALVSWLPPTENTDDSPLTDLAGFKIYYGTFPGDYTETITIDNPLETSYLVEDLVASDWFFVVTAFNASMIESTYSEEVFKTIN